MQGIIGCFLKREGSPSAQVSLDHMLALPAYAEKRGARVQRFDWPQCSLALVTLERTPAAFRPLVFEQGSGRLLLDGFVRDRQPFSDAARLVPPSAADELARLAAAFSGTYNMVAYDAVAHTLTIVTDRHGARYLYDYEDDDSFLMAPNPLTLLSSGRVKSRAVDDQAVISLLSHEYIMGDRSLAEAIRLLPFATVIRLSVTATSARRYWNLHPLAEGKHRTDPGELVEQGAALLQRAIQCYAGDGVEALIPLSGGMDSRTIAGFLSPVADVRALHVAYGFEEGLARRIARALDVDLTVTPLGSLSPEEQIDRFALCAAQSLHQFWIYPHLKAALARGTGNLIVDGYLMNEVIGGLSTIGTADYTDINRLYPPLHEGFRFLLGPRLADSYSAGHDAQVAEVLGDCPSDEPYDRYLYFSVLTYGRRFTLLFSVIHSHLCSVGLPVLDYDLFDFCLRLPREQKLHSRFYRQMLISRVPRVAPIPWSRNRLPLDSPRAQHPMTPLLRRWERAKYYAARLSGGRVETLPRHDKNRRFRRDAAFRRFFTDLVLSDRTLDRGYLSRDGAHTLVELIDSGRDYFDVLERIAMVELVCRELGLD